MEFRGPAGSRLAHVKGLGLAHAALRTAACRSVVGVGLSEDQVKLARGIRGMGPAQEQGKRCVLPGGNLQFLVYFYVFFFPCPRICLLIL